MSQTRSHPRLVTDSDIDIARQFRLFKERFQEEWLSRKKVQGSNCTKLPCLVRISNRQMDVLAAAMPGFSGQQTWRLEAEPGLLNRNDRHHSNQVRLWGGHRAMGRYVLCLMGRNGDPDSMITT
jgi:hypothetical protein